MLKLKVKYDYCYNQLKIARDSISLLDSVNCQQDTIILNKNQEIILTESIDGNLVASWDKVFK